MVPRFAPALASVVVLLGLPSGVVAAEIRLKDGSRIEGVIRGLIVSRHIWVETATGRPPGATSFPARDETTYTYLVLALVNGRDIIAVHDSGVRTRLEAPRLMAAVVVWGGVAPPEDLEVLDALMRGWRHREAIRSDGERLLLVADAQGLQRVLLSGRLRPLSVLVPDSITGDQWLKALPEQLRSERVRLFIRKPGDLVHAESAVIGELRVSDTGRANLVPAVEVDAAAGVETVAVVRIVGGRLERK